MSNAKPVVSVITISYNQKDYIEHAIESMLAQNTSFSYEIIVADDGSKDGTQSIIASYAEKIPDVIRPILRKSNIGAWNNFVDAINQANGKYIALCEGDDFWTDETKLQQQVDFLEKHKDYTICFHPVRVFFEGKQKKDTVFPERNTDFNVDRLLKENFIQTNSVLYRAQKSYKNLALDVMPGDWYLHLFHAQFGKIGFIDSVMSAYRRHDQGLWWDAQNDIEKLWIKNGIQQLRMFSEVLAIYQSKSAWKKQITDNIAFLLDKFIDIDATHKTDLFMQATREMPEIVALYSKAQLVNIRYLFDERERLKLSLSELERENNAIKSSRRWKAGVKLQEIRHFTRNNKKTKA